MQIPSPLPRRRVRLRLDRGSGLLELVLALALLGLLGGFAARALSGLRDRWAVVGARDAVVQLVREARGRAVARAGARVLVSAADSRATLESGGTVLRTVDLSGEFGVTVDLGGAADAHLVFDPAGVGRMASRTVTLDRRGARARLVVSSYGRIR